MVAAAHPLAALEGVKALQEGGNAMDACLTMAGVTSVVLPDMCGLGGDAFFLYYDKRSGTVTGVGSSGTAGDAATIEHFASSALNLMPQEGILSVAVPGAPLAFSEAAMRFGTWKLERAFAPAIRIAQEGFVISPLLHHNIREQAEKLRRYGEGARVFLPGGKVPAVGEILYQPDLAKTLTEFAAGGSTWFYDGPFAAGFYQLNEATGGLFTGAEFKRHSLEVYEPLATTYRGYTVYENAPVSQGFTLLEELNIVEPAPLSEMDPLGAECVHLMVEAVKLAFEDRNRYAGDPKATGFDVDKLISKEWARERLAGINRATAKQDRYTPYGPSEGDTTIFVAVDEAGNACVFIHSIAFNFGSGVVVPGTGVVLNNRAGRSFNLVPEHPNSLAPGKKPMHTLNCYMVFQDKDLYLAGGTFGGDGQPQWNLQILSLILDHGAGPQEAVDFPRWLSFPGTDMINLDKPYELQLESRFPGATLSALSQKGHKVVQRGPWEGGGGAQIIMVDPETGLLVGASDHRVEGLAIGI